MVVGDGIVVDVVDLDGRTCDTVPNLLDNTYDNYYGYTKDDVKFRRLLT